LSKYIGRGTTRVYPLFVCNRPGRLIAEVERHTYFQLNDSPHRLDYPSYETHTLSDGGREVA